MSKVAEKEIYSTGEIADLTGVTVRTLQYYDNIDLLPATKRNESGHRLYDKSDLTKLQQIMFYKSLGLKINDIQEIVQETTTGDDLISRFEKQHEILYQRLNHLMGNLAYLETSLDLLKAEKELPITNLVQLINSLNQDTIFEYEQVAFDSETLEVFSNHYDNTAEILEVYWMWKPLVIEAKSLILDGISPKSKQALQFARRYTEMTDKITKGDENLLEVYMNSAQKRESWPEEDQHLLNFTENFIEEALTYYELKEDIHD